MKTMEFNQYKPTSSPSKTKTTKMDQLVHVVSFSGGRTSAFLVFLMEIARVKFGWNVKYVFCDTGIESPKTYKFIREVVKFWNIDLTILRLKVNPTLGQGNSYEVFRPEDLMNSAKMEPFQPFMDCLIKYGTPNVSGPYCSERMKKDVFVKYCKETYGKNKFVTWLGIRSDEPARLKPKSGIKYLADLIEIDKVDILNWWKKQPFDLDLESHSGNCIFCVKKSSKKLAMAIRSNPGFFNMFKYKIRDSRVRVKEGYDKEIMYRGKLSLQGVADMYEAYSTDELANMVANMRGEDTGSCSESCESFHPESEIDFNAVNNDIYNQFDKELGLGQFEFDLELA